MPSFEELKAEQAVPTIFADSLGMVVHVNGAFEKTFGWTAAEIRGKPLSVIIPRRFHDAHHLGFSRFLMTAKPTLMDKPLRLKAVTRDGREFDSEHLILAEKTAGGWLFGASIRPLPTP